MSELAIVVLAGGQSSRLGQPKQLIEINKRTLIERQCQLALAVSPHVFCVLGYQAELIRSRIKNLPVTVLVNPDWLQGMSSSIAYAVSELPQNIERVMIILVDQWQLNVKALNELINCSNNKPKSIFASESIESLDSVKPMIGPPSIFPKQYFTELINMNEKAGAKSLIMKHINNVSLIGCSEAFVDLDVAADLEQLRKIYPC